MLEQLESLIPVLEQHFLDPYGLLALLALIPLIVFYLARPRPEERLMPSIMFFRKNESDSALKSAFRRLMRNFMLILHILIILAFAFVLAEPFAEVPERPEDAVVVVDRSASMQGQEVVPFVEENLGEKNTVIVSGYGTQVIGEGIPSGQALSIVRNIDYLDTETDIISGIQTARSYPGRLVVASDLDQTMDNRDPVEALESISKPIEVMNTEPQNRFAITNIDVDRKSTDISIMNYGQSEDIEAQFNGEKHTISLDEGLNIHTVTPETGRNTFTVQTDGLKTDNTGYFYIPEASDISVYLESEDRYFNRAVELISETSVTNSQTNADVLYLNSDKNQDDVAERVRSGASAVVTKDSNALNNIFELDVSSKTRTSEVTINFPQRIFLGETDYRKTNISGESLSSPREAVQITDYGDGEILAFNAEMNRFRTNILYPIFWRHTLLRLTEASTEDQLNVKNGDTVTQGDQTQIFTNSGFHEIEGKIYASNLASEAESSPSSISPDFSAEKVFETTQKNLQNISVFLILFLMAIELIYLYKIGEIK